MAESSGHLDPKEATEAKLCAYLEGELSVSEREEIEQHLLGNPQHRQLLIDLAKTREWMRSIPALSAPSDIAEIFQGQVERAMLLDENDGASGSPFSRLPQIVLVAAIVLMTVGLGVVIFAMLRPPVLNKMMSLAKPPGAATSLPVGDSSVEKPQIVASTAQVKAKTLTAMDAPPTPVAAMPSVVVTKNLAMENAGIANSNNADFSADSVESKLLAAGYAVPSDQQTICFVISSDLPAETGEQVRGFFARHELIIDQPLADKLNAANNQVQQRSSTAPVLVALQSLANKQVGFAQTTMPTSAPTQQIYVSHGLTPLQLELLSASLATNNLNQNFRRVALNQAPATQPIAVSTGSIVKGQMLSVTIPQLVGPGIEKTNVVRVADDGTISLPMIDPVPAIGVTTAELEQRIVGRYRDASLIPQATVKVELPATTQPATRPTSQASTTMPTTQAIAAAQGISVVVLVESSK